MIQFVVLPDRKVFVRCDKAAVRSTIKELIVQCYHIGKRPKLEDKRGGR